MSKIKMCFGILVGVRVYSNILLIAVGEYNSFGRMKTAEAAGAHVAFCKKTEHGRKLWKFAGVVVHPCQKIN
jgi:hypothetical protein